LSRRGEPATGSVVHTNPGKDCLVAHFIPPSTRTPAARLRTWEKLGLVLFFAALVAFGVLVEVRSVFLKRRMGDLGVFLRAAWAVRAGADLYAVTDENEWHYHYPPLFAILLTPLADPPADADAGGTVPYPVSVAVWYVFSVLCLATASHGLARALERRSTDPVLRAQRPGSRGWWRLRVIPVLVCLPPIGGTLMRGQANLLILALLCGVIALTLLDRRLLAGVCLAGAICLKIFPALLLLYPLWRRDGRCLAGCALGLLLGLVVVPVLALGPARTWSAYEEWTEVLLRPALARGTDQSRAKELIEVTATDSQSLLAVWHNALHPDRYQRPPVASPTVRRAHWLAGGLLLLVTLAAGGRKAASAAWAEVAFFGLLLLVNILLSPVCHLHYFCLLLPLVMGLVAGDWECRASFNVGLHWLLVFGLAVVATAVPHLPGMEVPRDVGVATYGTLLLWLAGVSVLWLRPDTATEVAAAASDVSAAAA
jgi:alpha-1,2-mannosyltransferase